MRVRCVSDYVTEQQRAALGRRQYQGSLAAQLTIGAEYVVLGLSFEFDPEHYSTGPYVTVLLESGVPARYDMCLFEVTDPRASRYWEVSILLFGGRQITELAPPVPVGAFYRRNDETCSPEEQDEDYFAFLGSSSFAQVCELLQGEYPDTP